MQVLPTIIHGAEIEDRVVQALMRNSARIVAMLARGGYFPTMIRVRPDWCDSGDYSRCDEYQFENWEVGYAPRRPMPDFRQHCGRITGCLAGVLDEAGALPPLTMAAD